MSDIPSIPQDYTIHLDTDPDIFSDIRINQIQLPIIKLEASTPNPIKTDSKIDGKLNVGLDNIRIEKIPLIKTDSKVDAKLDVGLDNIRVKELPVVHLRFGAEPARLHAPAHWDFGVSVLGLRLLSFDVCGESMVVIEDYKPHKTEECA